jgi:NAD kinase
VTAAANRRVILVTRHTRLAELIARYNTLAQAKFYLEHLGADFGDFLREDEAYGRSLRLTVEALQAWGRYQVVDRSLVANFIFDASDIVLALGQDGLVANTMKYLHGQPLVGVNPDPSRWDGLLLPFGPQDLQRLLPEVAADRRAVKTVTMAEARLSDGQTLLGVNDLFIGPRTQSSALYEISHGGRSEFQSSSGLIVSTGLGSTAWLKSVVTGSLAIARAVSDARVADYQPMAWDASQLVFVVREPFPSRASGTTVVYGKVDREQPLTLRSRMPDNGVIFSDGMESDFLRFTAGMEATVGPAGRSGRLVV